MSRNMSIKHFFTDHQKTTVSFNKAIKPRAIPKAKQIKHIQNTTLSTILSSRNEEEEPIRKPKNIYNIVFEKQMKIIYPPLKKCTAYLNQRKSLKSRCVNNTQISHYNSMLPNAHIKSDVDLLDNLLCKSNLISIEHRKTQRKFQSIEKRRINKGIQLLPPI